MNDKIILSKIYSRETSVFYFRVWDESDRKGSQMFIGEPLLNDIRVAPPRGQNGDIWFSKSELDHLMTTALQKINSESELRDRMVAHTEAAWQEIKPYLVDKKDITSVAELESYFNGLTAFWCAMNTPIFQLFDRDDLDASFKQRMFAIREKTQEYTQRMSDTFVEYFEKTFPQYRHLTFHVTWEDAAALENGIADITMLERRAQEGCFIFRGEVLPVSRLQETLDKNNLVFEKIETEIVREAKGSIGFKGVVRGVAKIVHNQSELSKIKDGDILVTSATDPSYVPYMQKAAGFVTDEGGIMSHAAIVAREMKKPCIIGTKIATQIFKDGDSVEVDAENGVVRKL